MAGATVELIEYFLCFTIDMANVQVDNSIIYRNRSFQRTFRKQASQWIASHLISCQFYRLVATGQQVSTNLSVSPSCKHVC